MLDRLAQPHFLVGLLQFHLLQVDFMFGLLQFHVMQVDFLLGVPLLHCVMLQFHFLIEIIVFLYSDPAHGSFHLVVAYNVSC